MNWAPQHRLTEAYHDVSKTTDQYELRALQRSVTNPGQINTAVLQMMPMMSDVWNDLQIMLNLMPVVFIYCPCVSHYIRYW